VVPEDTCSSAETRAYNFDVTREKSYSREFAPDLRT
jgi:hypothetical protein